MVGNDMPYTNNTFTARNFREVQKLYPGVVMHRDHPENWPEGPWQWVEPEPQPVTKEQRRSQLKWERDDRVSAPINNVQVGRTEDRENITGTLSNWELLGLGESIDWIMADNTVQSLTQSDLQSVVDAYALRKLQLFGVYQGLLQQLETTDDPESIVWPD